LKRKISIILSLILVMALATPVFAAVNLEVNGRDYEPSYELYLENGVTLVPLDVITDALGCDVTTEGDQITYQENDNSLQMNINSTTAVVNGTNQTMPMAPRMINNQIYVPLRFVLESLGAQVGWDSEASSVSVTYNETRNGMTAAEIMAKASVAMAEANQSKMSVDLKSTINMKADLPDSEALDMAMDMNGTVEAWMQMEPMVMYMKQNMTVDVPDAPIPGSQAVNSEMVINQDGIFMTMPEIGWVKMNLEGLDMEALMEQSMTQDPATVMKQMRDMGMTVTLAQDQVKEGKKYYVINAVMGSDTLNSEYYQQLTQQMSALGQDLDLQQMLENMDIDMVYDMWIDQETFYTDYMNLIGDIKLKIDIPESEEVPGGTMEMAMTMTAAYRMSDYGQEFAVPDIKDARDFEEVLAEQVAQAEVQQLD
jgi:hypothetical protein